MQFLAVIRRRTEAFTEAQFAGLQDAEATHVRELYAAGTVREAFSRGDVLGAVLRIEASDEPEARAVVASLPFALQGMAELERLIWLRPYRGFAP